MKTTLAIAGAILCASITSSVACAGAVPAPRTVTVHTADLNLASPAGQRTLDRRIDQAVRQVCGEPSALVPGGRRASDRCRAETRAAADRQLARLVAAATGQAAFLFPY